jgi:electron transfer flavoprotein alpha subunit
MLAVIPVRHGVLPAGAAETADECGHRCLLIGSGVEQAAHELGGDIQMAEVGDYRPSAWAQALAAALATTDIIVLPASPDGRDLGPRLAAELDRQFFAAAMVVDRAKVIVPRDGGLTMHTIVPPGQFVATLQVGVRGTGPASAPTRITRLKVPVIDSADGDAHVREVLPADAATIDLTEASRIVGGGAGLSSAAQFDRLALLGGLIGASVGATRVITDRGWIEHERQIGTTGVVVNPHLYLAFGISGAVQHTSGLGHPEHIISVNTDAHCPMMQLADLAVVADANEVLDELIALLTHETLDD